MSKAVTPLILARFGDQRKLQPNKRTLEGAAVRFRPHRFVSVLKNSSLAWQWRRTEFWRRSHEDVHRVNERKFYQAMIEPLPDGSIIDIGANRGSKTEIFLGLAPRIVAVEPDPASVRTLKARFRWKPTVTVIEAAVSSKFGKIPFYDFGAGSAYNTASEEWAQSLIDGTNHMGLKMPRPIRTLVCSETLANLISAHDPVKYVKIDAEGFEEQVISTLMRSVPLISMEFNLPETLESLERCINRLQKLDQAYRFNVSITEPPERLECESWINGDEVSSHIRAAGWRFVELYARSGAFATHATVD